MGLALALGFVAGSGSAAVRLTLNDSNGVVITDNAGNPIILG